MRFFQNINGIKDPHTYQDTIIGGEITNEQKIHHYLGLNKYASYQKGFTVFSTLGNQENANSNYIYLYNHKRNKLTQAYQNGTNPNGDYHSAANCYFLPDGRIITTNETQHNDQISIKRSLKPYDITNFEEIALITDDIAYPYMHIIGDVLYIIGRTFPLIENGILKSSDYGETWSPITTILNTGNFPDYWAYNRPVFSKNKIMFFMNRRNQVGAGNFDRIYFLQSDDGINFYNIDNTFSKNVSVSEISSTELENYFVTDASPNANFITDTASINNKPYCITQTPTSDDTLDFIYHNGNSWQTKTISISGVSLKDVNSLALCANSETDFILYACNYNVFSESPNLESRIVKIITDDAFDTNSFNYLSETGNDYSIVGAYNYSEFKKTAIMCLTLKERGTGSDVSPINGYSDFKIIDVIN
jgi:hypothetical protein